MTTYVNPFNDVGFKLIFGKEESKELLITLLNELLFKGVQHIKSIEYLDKENHGNTLDEHGTIYDLFCKTEDGTHIIVEMQNAWHVNFIGRALTYMGRAISRMAPVGQTGIEGFGERYRLCPLYGVFFLNYKEEDLDPEFRTDVAYVRLGSGKLFTDSQLMVFLQFPYFNKELDECETLYDKLFYAIKNMSTLQKMPEQMSESIFAQLDRLASRAHLSEDDEIAYQRAWDRYETNRLVEYSQMLKSRKEGLAAGRAEGLAAGRAEGLAAGRAEGRAEGRTESKREIALNMKKNGCDVELIIACTGLSREEIESIN